MEEELESRWKEEVETEEMALNIRDPSGQRKEAGLAPGWESHCLLLRDLEVL